MSITTILALASFGVSVVGWIFTAGRQAEKFRGQLNGLGRRVTMVETSWANIQGRVDELSKTAISYELARREAETSLRERITAVETRLEERDRSSSSSSERTGS